MRHIKEYNDFEELSRELGNLNHSIRGMVRNALPEDVYKDDFLDLEELEDFRVRINKSGFVTYIHINGMLNKDSIESEFNRVLLRMRTIKNRLEEKYGFDCHFMIYLNGEGQQENNPVTHKNDLYKFLGFKKGIFGQDRFYTYTKNPSQSDILSNMYKEFPEDKVALEVRFMII